ncbi:MAG: hypothetical protein ACR2F9_01115 [Longimicrobiaceae bacterium]
MPLAEQRGDFTGRLLGRFFQQGDERATGAGQLDGFEQPDAPVRLDDGFDGAQHGPPDDGVHMKSSAAEVCGQGR